MNRIQKAAQELVEKYGTRCPYEMADYLGIEVCLLHNGTTGNCIV